MINVNEELFKRQSPNKKLDIVVNLKKEELLNTTPETVKRILKEVGDKIGKSNNKRIYIPHDRRGGNNWNSTVEAFDFIKGNLVLEIYFQMDNTDTSVTEDYYNFFKLGEYRGTHKSMDIYGNEQTYYFTYSEDNKAEVLRSILLQYVHTKYIIK